MTHKGTEVVVFSIRLDKEDKQLLGLLARSLKTQPAVLSRQYVVEGMRRALDPDAITQRADEEKNAQLALAEQLRQQFSSCLE